MKKDLGWVGVGFGVLFLVLSPKHFLQQNSFSLLVGFFFFFELFTEFFSPALLGLSFHVRNLVAIPVSGIPFRVSLPCSV